MLQLLLWFHSDSNEFHRIVLSCAEDIRTRGEVRVAARGLSAALSPAGVTENTGVELTGQESRTDTEPALCLLCQTLPAFDERFPSNTGLLVCFMILIHN